MALSIKTTLLISFILLFYIFQVNGNSSGADHVFSLHKDRLIRMHARKLSMLDAVLDYDDPGANPKHDPKRGRGGGGGRNR